MFVLTTEESLLRILSEVQKNMHQYFHHTIIYNSENFEIISVDLDVTGRGSEDGIIHGRDLLGKTSGKDKEGE